MTREGKSFSTQVHSFANTTVAEVNSALLARVNKASLSKLTHILVLCIAHHT